MTASGGPARLPMDTAELDALLSGWQSQAMHAARADGASWDEVGAATGVSGERAREVIVEALDRQEAIRLERALLPRRRLRTSAWVVCDAMSADAARGLARLAPIVRTDLEQLARAVAARIVEASEFYRDPERFARGEVADYVRRNIEYLLDREPVDDADPEAQPRLTGRDHALRGVPLADVLAAYRIGFALLWEAITQAMVDSGAVGYREVVDAASELWWRADHFGHAVTGAHRDATTEMLLRRDRERSATVEALVTGSVVGRGSLGEVAARLGMPQRGHFLVVVSADAPGQGDPLPGISEALRECEVISAWRLASREALGVLSLPTPDPAPAVSCLEEHALGRVGVGPLFSDLDAAPQAYYLAGIAARSRGGGDSWVRLFARTPIAMLVAGAPDVAAGVATDVLGPVLALPEQDRNVLLQTFEVWLESEGSIPVAGKRLYCHANTVRYRLRKLGELTGRFTDVPGAVADLAVAVQAWRLVGDQDGV
ncbi:helix-turn-helix domain-containing protein [Actinomycetospora endophytica]|uniref:Helix-turn-helix domain-containing protein n=1 Tax=Actinomycetospora endophytica TaxID=2291215 RepID=A0ABS8PCJ5_9PSEU|nr:helix-turn-helix domain-containing protein [Actinomycetospora endophytica]MCD2195874.1 helix-turn-helix domain-containing protein [Actinomycetospora endophytica]